MGCNLGGFLFGVGLCFWVGAMFVFDWGFGGVESLCLCVVFWGLCL